MRTLMMFVSIAMVGVGTFCIANASVAFTSTAFLVGLVILALGIVELLVARNTSINEDRGDMTFSVSGMIMVFLGVSILAGVVSDDVTISAIFALILARDGFIDLFSISRDVSENTREENMNLAVAALSVLLAAYMLFNGMLLNLDIMLLAGLAIILMGVRRFIISLEIKYSHPGFLTGNEERLADAQREEKRALAKAKEGIRESKEAQRRIEKIKNDIKNERKNMTATSVRANRDRDRSGR